MNAATSLPKKRRPSNAEDRRFSKRPPRKPSGGRETPEPPASSSPSWLDKRVDKCTRDHSLLPFKLAVVNHLVMFACALFLFSLEQIASTLICLVPPLPPLSDPELFIRFHDAVERTADDYKRYSVFKKHYTPWFVDLSKLGDAWLAFQCRNIIREYFGAEPQISHAVFEATTSNANWILLSLAYNMDRLVNAPEREKQDDKMWADIWEAYWGALFLERSLWNDGDEDLVSCLRFLFWLQNYDLIRKYGMDPRFTDVKAPEFQSVIPKSDVDVEEVKDAPGLKLPQEVKKKGHVLGYRAKIKRTSPDYVRVSIYSEDKEKAISNLRLYCNSPLKR